MLFLEFTAAPAMGLLFLGIGALVTGFAVGLGFFEASLWQWIICLSTTVVSAAFLWKPMKNWRGNGNLNFNDMRGDTVEILKDLKTGKTGTAKWNGVAMKARLAEDVETLQKGVEAEIVAVEGNVLIVK